MGHCHTWNGTQEFSIVWKWFLCCLVKCFYQLTILYCRCVAFCQWKPGDTEASHCQGSCWIRSLEYCWHGKWFFGCCGLGFLMATARGCGHMLILRVSQRSVGCWPFNLLWAFAGWSNGILQTSCSPSFHGCSEGLTIHLKIINPPRLSQTHPFHSRYSMACIGFSIFLKFPKESSAFQVWQLRR